MNYKKKYKDLYLEASMLRQTVAEYLKDPDEIYKRLDKIAPLMSEEQEKELYKEINKHFKLK